MTKVGRNHPCPCGSGKKFKKCHGNFAIPAVASAHLDSDFRKSLEQKIRGMEAERIQREKQQGLGRGIVSAKVKNQRVVIVGNEVRSSPNWATFHDFLRDYIFDILGRDWFKAEQTRPKDQRHPIVRWFDQSIEDIRRLGKRIGELHTAPMTGAQRAFLNLAYNLYLIAHHAEPAKAKSLLQTFVSKLKSDRTDDFIGKLFETYAAATFLKAGFKLAYENESDGSGSHVEFVATNPATGKKFSVEVKARNRRNDQDGPIDNVKRLRVANKLLTALAKKAEHTRIVMIEINVPDVLTGPSLEGWPSAALQQVRHIERTFKGEKPFAYVIVTNHAFHNNLDAVGTGAQVLATGFNIPDFGPDIGFNRFKDVLQSEERNKDALAVLDSMRTHYDIPVTFDGQIPEMVFQQSTDLPPLKFGRWYEVPKKEGGQVLGCLIDAVVLEKEKMVYGTYRGGDGHHFIATSPMSEPELAAWRKHPDTFFGEIRQITHKSENWLDLAKFLYASYKNTPRDKLLEWMKGAQDIAELAVLSQEELAIAYCERMAWSVEVQQRKSSQQPA